MTGVLLLVVAAAAHSLQPIESSFELAMAAYRSAAEAQLRCEDEQAMKTVASLDVATIRALSREIGRPNRQPGWPPGLIASTLVLHTRVALHYDLEEDAASDVHLTAARQLLGVLPALNSDLYARVAPRWYAIVAAHLQNRLALVRLSRHLNDVPDQFTREPSLLLARGSMYQLLASAIIPRQIRMRLLPPPIGRAQLPEWVASEQRVQRDLAQKDFRAAIAAAPDDAEAYVRLADLLSGDGRRDEAADLLLRAKTLPSAATLKYWGALVEGRIKQDGGDVDGARAAYARAATLMPAAQAPQVALAHLDLTTGHAREAAATVRAYLARSARAQDNHDDDPWWQYMFGQAWRLDAMVDDMLREIRSCRPR